MVRGNKRTATALDKCITRYGNARYPRPTCDITSIITTMVFPLPVGPKGPALLKPRAKDAKSMSSYHGPAKRGLCPHILARTARAKGRLNQAFSLVQQTLFTSRGNKKKTREAELDTCNYTRSWREYEDWPCEDRGTTINDCTRSMGANDNQHWPN